MDKIILRPLYNLLFLCFAIIYSFLAILASTEVNLDNDSFSTTLAYSKILVVIVLLLITYCRHKIDYFELFLILLAILLGVTLDPYLITISFFILTSISFSTLFKLESVKYIAYLNNALLFFVLGVFFLYFLGYLEGKILHDSSEYAIGDKISFGFSHPNKASIIICHMLLLSFCIKQRITFLICLILYLYTFLDLGGRTALGGISVFFILFLLKNLNGFRFFIRNITIFIYLAFPILLTFFISQEIWYIGEINLNYILSSRLSLMRELYINNDGIHISPINIQGKIVDVGIANFLIGMGWIAYFGLVWIINSYLKKESNIYFIMLSVSILFMNLMENMFNANMIVGVIIFSRYLAIRKQEGIYAR